MRRSAKPQTRGRLGGALAIVQALALLTACAWLLSLCLREEASLEIFRIGRGLAETLPVHSEALIETPVETPVAIPTAAPTEEPVVMIFEVLPAPTATACAWAPTPAPTPATPLGEARAAEQALPALLKLSARAFEGEREVSEYARETPVSFDGEYARLPGVTTFRGGNLRDGGAYGLCGLEKGTLELLWRVPVGGIDKWSGVGWNGQPAIVRWPEDVRAHMNLEPALRGDDGFVEVVYAALDGRVHFLNLRDGERSRPEIDIGCPIKGSVAVDPRGLPLLYVGQGIPEARGKSKPIGFRVFSLTDGSQLFFLNGLEKQRARGWGAFDSVALVHADTDTLIVGAENGLLYTMKLGSSYDAATGALSVNPKLQRYRYSSKLNGPYGIENSVAACGPYAYFTDNAGLLQCVDLNRLQPVWAQNVHDDSDATCALERGAQGELWLYTACEVDRQGKGGKCYMGRYDALTGERLWERAVPCAYNADVNGGALGSPALGVEEAAHLVYFNVARTGKGGTLLALDKATGETVWQLSLNSYSWSSPVVLRDGKGRVNLALGDSSGRLMLMDARTGEIRASVKLGGNIEGSPAVYENLLVVGTRGGHIACVRIE